MRRLTATTAAPFFHVDPVIDQNTLRSPWQPEGGGRTHRRRRRHCAVQTGRLEQSAAGQRCSPVMNLSELKLFTAHTSTMRTGVFMESLLGKLVPRVLSLFLLINLCLAAPGLPGTQREEITDAQPPSVALPNPFGTGEEDRKLLQSYIQSSLKDGQGGPEITTWEQEVFFLFGLYDYDRSGLLDGLEMMKLLSDYKSHHTPGAQANEQVVSMVDFLLQTQDLNQDGLLAPSELLSPALPHTQNSSNNNAPQQEQEVAAGDKLSKLSADEEKAGAEVQTEDAHDEVQPHAEEEPQHEEKPEEEEAAKEIDEQKEAPAAEQGQDQGVLVHQGQPEI